MYPATLTPNVALKNPSLKAIREFESFDREPFIHFACHTENKSYTFLHHKLVSVGQFFSPAGEKT